MTRLWPRRLRPPAGGRWEGGSLALNSNFCKILTGSRGGIKIMPCGAQFMGSQKLESRKALIPFKVLKWHSGNSYIYRDGKNSVFFFGEKVEFFILFLY
jgi:hypothetical protein